MSPNKLFTKLKTVDVNPANLFRRVKNLNTFESLGLRDYRLLWAGQLSTSMAQWMDQTTRSYLIFDLTGSYLKLGIVSACRGIPLLLFGVVAGTVADRYGTKAQLIIAQTVNAILNVVLATLVITHTIQPWHIYVTAFLAGTVQAFQQPARQVLINELVGGKHLMNAISLNSAAINVSRSIGPAVAALLITTIGTHGSYYVQAGIYAFATIWTIQIVVPKTTASVAQKVVAKGESFFTSTKEGFAYIAKNRLILAMMVLALAPVMLGMPYTSMMPAFAKDVFHGGANSANIQGWLVGAVGVGAVIGTLTIASLGRAQGSGKLMLAGATCFGISLVLFSRSPVWQVAIIFTFLAGLTNSAYTTQNQTIIQTLAPANLRGRVLGVYFLNRGLMPIGSLAMGALAQWLNSPAWAVTIMGGACIVVVIVMTIITPQMLKLGNINPGEGNDAPPPTGG